jgi:two-component sensor histidine kinase
MQLDTSFGRIRARRTFADNRSASQVSIEGASLETPAVLPQPLMLALHELATNALRYVVLSTLGYGKVLGRGPATFSQL